MGSRETWSVLMTGVATVWLLVALWMSLAYDAPGLDSLFIALAFGQQLSLVLAWDFFPRLPLWIVAGHGLILASLALGLIITVPAAAVGVGVGGVPWFVVGLVPPGVFMVIAAAVRWQRSHALAH